MGPHPSLGDFSHINALNFITTRGAWRVLSFFRWRTQSTERSRGFWLAGGRAGIPAVCPRAHVSRVNPPPEQPLQGLSTVPSNSQTSACPPRRVHRGGSGSHTPLLLGRGAPSRPLTPPLLFRPTRWTSSLRAACFTTWFLRAATRLASPCSDRPTSSWAPTASTAYSPRSTVSGQQGVRGRSRSSAARMPLRWDGASSAPRDPLQGPTCGWRGYSCCTSF